MNMIEFPVSILILPLMLFPALLAIVLVRRSEANQRTLRREVISEARGESPPGAKSPLQHVSDGPRSWVTRLVEAGALLVFFGGFVLLLAWAQASWRQSAQQSIHRVVTTLDEMGYGGSQVQVSTNVLCRRGDFGYRWSAAGARGSACVRDGAVSIVVAQRWSADTRSH